MPYKFKLGQRAKVVRVPSYAPIDIKAVVGRVVEVIEIRPSDGFTPYVVKDQGRTWRASAWNLEAAPAKKTHKKRGK